jgi:hypothetical protein
MVMLKKAYYYLFFFMMSLTKFFITCKMNKGQKFTSSLGNIVKGATQVNGYSLNLHFCVFEKSQGKHNSLDYHFFFGEIFLINCKVNMFKA